MKPITSISCLLLTGCVSKSHPKMLSFTPASVVGDQISNNVKIQAFTPQAVLCRWC